jgi:hypothetical protein
MAASGDALLRAEYTLRRTAEGFGLKLDEAGVVTSSTKAAAAAGLPEGAQIVAVDGIAVSGKVEVLARVRASTEDVVFSVLEAVAAATEPAALQPSVSRPVRELFGDAPVDGAAGGAAKKSSWISSAKVMAGRATAAAAAQSQMRTSELGLPIPAEGSRTQAEAAAPAGSTAEKVTGSSWLSSAKGMAGRAAAAAAQVGLGRIAALYCRSSTSSHIR